MFPQLGPAAACRAQQEVVVVVETAVVSAVAAASTDVAGTADTVGTGSIGSANVHFKGSRTLMVRTYLVLVVPWLTPRRIHVAVLHHVHLLLLEHVEVHLVLRHGPCLRLRRHMGPGRHLLHVHRHLHWHGLLRMRRLHLLGRNGGLLRSLLGVRLCSAPGILSFGNCSLKYHTLRLVDGTYPSSFAAGTLLRCQPLCISCRCVVNLARTRFQTTLNVNVSAAKIKIASLSASSTSRTENGEQRTCHFAYVNFILANRFSSIRE